jgi:drug/metabolite transporter (DMT)-like permease
MKSTLTVLSFIFIIFGIFLTLENYQLFIKVSGLWPLLLVVIGIGLIFLFFNRKGKDTGLIWLGSFFASFGIFFLYLNYTSWSDLSYLWPFFLCIVGISFAMSGIFAKRKVLVYFAIIFIVMFLAFYLVFTISILLWPLSFVVFGLSLLIINYFNNKDEKSSVYRAKRR